MSTDAMLLHTDPIPHNDFIEATVCIFCQPSPHEILAETEHFYVTLDANPLLEGHVDIHTKEHIGCSAEIDQQYLTEFLELKSWVGKLITQIYGKVSFYEHGRAGHCGMIVGGVMCHHFHMHALPLAEDIEPEVSNYLRMIRLDHEHKIASLYEQYDQYLYFENDSGQKYFFVVDKPLPNHYLRTIIANAISVPERADWSAFFDRNSMNSFKQKVKNLKVQK